MSDIRLCKVCRRRQPAEDFGSSLTTCLRCQAEVSSAAKPKRPAPGERCPACNRFVQGSRKQPPELVVPPGSKYCPKCRAVKPLGDYHSDASRPDGVEGICKACKAPGNRSRSKAYYEANRERLKALAAERRRANQG